MKDNYLKSATIKLKSLIFSAGYLSLGTLCAQGINFITLFYLTRYSSVDALNLLALLTANISGLAPFLSFRYEVAVVVIKAKTDRYKLTLVSLLFSLCLALLLICAIVFQSDFISGLLGIKNTNILIFLVAILLNNINTFGIALLNSEARYIKMAYAQLIQAVTCLFFTIICIEIFNENAAILGLTLSYLCLATYYIINLRHDIRHELSIKNLYLTAKSNWRYPVISMPMAVVNGYHQALPVLFIAKYFSATEVALYYVIQRYIGSPLGVISNAISNISLKDFSDSTANNLIKMFLIYMGFMFFVGSAALFVISVLPISVFHFMVGNESLTNSLLIVLAIPIIVKSMVAPLSSILPAMNRLSFEAFWKLPAFLTLLLTLSLLVSKNNFYEFILKYAAIESVLYFGYAFICFHVATINSKR
jgi:O-antigen/teichoic acid export membrane protein